MDDTRERPCMMFVQTQHKLVNMNVDRVAVTEPIHWGKCDQKIKYEVTIILLDKGLRALFF
jgi:hypothetical protein